MTWRARTMAETAVKPPADDGASKLVQCREVPDLYLAASRALIGSLCRSFLDQMALTPTELLYSSRNHTRLEGAGNLLREVVERAGSMQARAVGENAPNRIRDLQQLLEKMSSATRELEAKEPAVQLKAGGFLQTIAALRANTPAAAQPTRVFRMVTEYLQS